MAAYDDFLILLRKQIEEALRGSAEISIGKVLRNNGEERDTLMISWYGENIAPVIYLKDYYELYETGIDVEEIVDLILHTCREHRVGKHMDAGFFEDFDRAKERIVCRLIHYEKNRKLLKEIPYTRFLDLAIIYYYLLEDDLFDQASILIRNEHLRLWGIRTEELHRKAKNNTFRLLPADFQRMADMLGQLSGNELDFHDEMDNCPLYVLTSRGKCFGAVSVLDNDCLEKISLEIGEDYYLIPSSIHEFIIVPVSAGIEEESLRQMLRDINQSELEPEDILSDSLYRYSSLEHEMLLVPEKD